MMLKKLTEFCKGMYIMTVGKTGKRRIMEDSILKDKVVMITGGSRGIGKAIAEKVAEQKAKIILTAKSSSRLVNAAKELRALGADVHPISCDFEDIKEVESMAEEACGYYGKLDILINNAGVGIMKPMEESSVEEWHTLMNINALAPFVLCQKCLPSLKQSDYAMIVNIGSVMAVKGYVNQSMYAASKHALMGFTKVMSQEYQEYGIRVHAVNPGGVATDLARTMRPDLDTTGMMKPEEIAEIVLFLLLHRNNAVIDDLHIRRSTGGAWF